LPAVISIASQTYQALALLEREPMVASAFGAELWRHRARGRTVSANGGGDYAAQCFLGRLRKRGLVETDKSPAGSMVSIWTLTPAGRRALQLAREKHQ
jgi:hypothetical protein